MAEPTGRRGAGAGRAAAARTLGWDAIIALHDAAVHRYAEHAGMIAAVPGMWDAPRAPGSWSPAEITTHLLLSFEAGEREIVTSEPMASRTRWYHRVVIRATFYRRLLAGGPFPSGARAPRETRPPRASEDAATLIARFRTTADRLMQVVRAEQAARPSFRLSHPYFGRITLADAVYVSARHIDHHRAQLPALPGASAQR